MEHVLASQVVEQFRNAYPQILLDPDIIGLQVSVADPPVLEIIVSRGRLHANFARDRGIPNEFSYGVDMQRGQLQVSVREGDILVSQEVSAYAPRSGDAVRGNGSSTWGTLDGLSSSTNGRFWLATGTYFVLLTIRRLAVSSKSIIQTTNGKW